MSPLPESKAPAARWLLDPFIREQLRSSTTMADEPGPSDGDLDEDAEFDLNPDELAAADDEDWDEDDDLDEDGEEWEDDDGDDDDLDDDLIDLDDEYDDFGEDDDREGGGFVE